MTKHTVSEYQSAYRVLIDTADTNASDWMREDGRHFNEIDVAEDIQYAIESGLLDPFVKDNIKIEKWFDPYAENESDGLFTDDEFKLRYLIEKLFNEYNNSAEGMKEKEMSIEAFAGDIFEFARENYNTL